MAEEDIYKSKRKYKVFLDNLEDFSIEPRFSAKPKGRGFRKKAIIIFV